MERSLLIGCGRNHKKQIILDGNAEWAGELTTMDINPNIGADIVFDMERVATERQPLPFDDDTFVEAAMHNCAEHWGRQGDFRGWFWECSEYHRVLKPGGLLYFLVPVGEDALADPGHTRFFHENWFFFLNQEFYTRNEVVKSCFTDYRGWAWDKNFDIVYMGRHGNPHHHLAAILRKA